MKFKMELRATIINGDLDSQKLMLQANIPFTYIIQNSRFTHMRDQEEDPMSEDNTESSEKFYQRRINGKKIDALKKYIRKSILREHGGKRVCVLFPTALLLAVDGEISQPRIDRMVDLDNIRRNESEFYIVDGQHRLWAMKELYQSLDTNPDIFGEDSEDLVIKKYLDRFQFNCTILLNFDLWEQAQIFADINFNQKKVDKSLYYSIYGLMDPNEIEDVKTSAIFVAHTLVKYLNTGEKSVLRGLIRMLGNGNGLISQAFIADALIKNLRTPRGIWYSEPGEVQERISYFAFELSLFFKIIKEKFPNEWPEIVNDKPMARSIITKTTGMGALLRLLVYVHIQLLGDSDFSTPGVRDYMINHYYDDAMWILSGLEGKGAELFGFFGEFSGTGGKGLESRLYSRMLVLINKPTSVNEEFIEINNEDVDVTYHKDDESLYSFSLSKYFQNPDQMAPYRPGSGALAVSMYHLRFKLGVYAGQISPDATAHDA